MHCTSFRKFAANLLMGAMLIQPALAAQNEYRIPLKGLRAAPAPTPGKGDGVIDAGDNLTPPVLTLSPASLKFDLTDGAPDTQSSVLTNKGTAPAAVTGIVSTADFSVSHNCSNPLPVGVPCTISAIPTASAEAGAQAQLALSAPGIAVPALLQLSTFARTNPEPSPWLRLSNSQVNLGTTLKPGEASSGSSTLTNVGNADATLGGITSGDDFPVHSDCPAILVAGAQCTIYTSFSSYVPGNHSHVLYLTSGASGMPMPLALYAYVQRDPAKRPSLSFDTSVLSFGQLESGATATKTARLTNSGTAPAVLSPLASFPEFSVKSDCPATLSIGASCTLSVTFKAGAPGSAPAYALVARGQDDVVAELGLTGSVPAPQGSGPEQQLVLSSSVLSFGDVPVKQASTLTATLTNGGSTPALLKSVTLGSGEDVFSQTNDCGASIAPGASCTLSVTFKPMTAQQRFGWVTLAKGDSEQVTLPLSGNGQAAVLSAGLATVQLGAVTMPGKSATQSVSLGNAGNIPLTGLTLTNSDSRLTLGYGDCSNTLQPKQGCTLSVQYAPASDGHISSSFQISSGNGGATTINVIGTAVVLSASPSSLAFPATRLGSSAPDQSVTLRNNGQAAVNLDGIGLTSGARQFGQSNNCGSSLAAGATCRIVVRYTPDTVKANTTASHQGELWLTSNGTPVTRVGLAGTGTNPQLTLSPDAVSLPSTAVGQRSAPVTLNITNASTETATLASINISQNSGEFTQTNNCGPELAAQATCAVTLQLTPAATGGRAGTLSVTSFFGTYNVALNGQGTSQLALSATTLSFPSTDLSQSAAPKSFTVTNRTQQAATFTGMGVVNGTSDYGQSNNCGSGLAAGASCTVNIQFTPAATGDRAGAWSVVSSLGTETVALIGQGTQPVGVLDAPGGSAASEPTSDGLTHYGITFLDTEVSTSSAVRNIAFSNKGTGALTIQGISQLNGSADFNQSNNCGTTLSPGQSCTISLIFTPSALGARTGQVVLLSETGDYAFDLSGKGTGANGQWRADTSADFGKVAVGSSAQRSFTFQNTGTLLASNMVTTLSGADLTLVSNSCGTAAAPVVVPVGATCNVTVRYAPTAPGSLADAALTASGRVANGPVVQPLSGSAPTPALAFDATPNGEYGNITVGKLTVRTFTLRNTGQLPDNLASAPVVSGTGFTLTGGSCVSGLALPAGGTCTVNVTATSATEAPLTGAVSTASSQGASTQLDLKATAVVRATDASFANVGFLLSADNASGTTLDDAGPGRAVMTNTRGNMVVGFSPYGAAGRSYKTNNGGYFSPEIATVFGANSFTFETWVYLNGPLTYRASDGSYPVYILGNAQGVGGAAELAIYGPGTTPSNVGVGGAAGGGPRGAGAAYPFALNTWYHIAAVRNGNTLSVYVNGNRIVSQATSGSFSSSRPRVGGNSFSGWEGTFNGYLSDTRLTLGVARYTGATFAVPTAPLPTQ